MNEVLFVSLTLCKASTLIWLFMFVFYLVIIPILFYIASIIDVYRYDRRGIRIVGMDLFSFYYWFYFIDCLDIYGLTNDLSCV